MNGIRGVSFRETPKGLEVHVHKTTKGLNGGKLKKRLPYSFKQMSTRILQAKTSDAARPVVDGIRAKLSWLYKKLKTGEYSDSEISAAIIHAAAMEKIAKRKVRHLEEEEAAKNGSGIANAPGEEEEIYGKEELKEDISERAESAEEEMKKLMEDIEKLEKELAEESLSELQDMISCTGREMSEEEIEELKRKHRSEEERQLTKADLEYLKAMFDRLEQERNEVKAGNVSGGTGGETTFSFAVECIPEVEMAEFDVGEAVDLLG